MRFTGQTIIVTGGGYGIGRAIAIAFGREGGDVVIAGRSRDKLETVAAELRALGTRPLVVEADVRRDADVGRLFAEASATYGRLDVLVNNSGIAGPTALVRDVTLDEWRETMDVNLTGAFLCAKHASAVMIEARRGVIVNIASIAGRIGFPRRAPYAASKWGMIGLSHALAAELGPFGVRVNAVLPGAIAGERFEGVVRSRAQAAGKSYEEELDKALADTPLRRLVEAEEVAETVTFLASDAASGITGQALNVCGGLRMQ
jgi:NAD(P)-dependent dehydrogenase (short-subunit alcohol dehydrogenase family)